MQTASPSPGDSFRQAVSQAARAIVAEGAAGPSPGGLYRQALSPAGSTRIPPSYSGNPFTLGRPGAGTGAGGAVSPPGGQFRQAIEQRVRALATTLTAPGGQYRQALSPPTPAAPRFPFVMGLPDSGGAVPLPGLAGEGMVLGTGNLMDMVDLTPDTRVNPFTPRPLGADAGTISDLAAEIAAVRLATRLGVVPSGSGPTAWPPLGRGGNGGGTANAGPMMGAASRILAARSRARNAAADAAGGGYFRGAQSALALDRAGQRFPAALTGTTRTPPHLVDEGFARRPPDRPAYAPGGEGADVLIGPGAELPSSYPPIPREKPRPPADPLERLLPFPVQSGRMAEGDDVWGERYFEAWRDNRTRKHAGIDLEAAPGESVTSSVPGVVTNLGWVYKPEPGQPEYRYVEVTTNDREVARYLYVDPAVKVGDRVEAGVTLIGSVQDLNPRYPGIANHVHFEMRDSGKARPPLDVTGEGPVHPGYKGYRLLNPTQAFPWTYVPK